MEVASPIQLCPTPGGTKRSLSCSPQLVETSVLLSTSEMSVADEPIARASKRCRFQTDAAMEDLSQSFSSQSVFFRNTLPQQLPSAKNNLLANTSAWGMKRNRLEVASVANEELKKVLLDHVSTIENLRNEKSDLLSNLQSMKTDHDRVTKENTILRRAVTIQQGRHTKAENDLKVARTQQSEVQERIRGLEQVIISLRYHLQTQQNHHETDFLHHRSPDVF